MVASWMSCRDIGGDRITYYLSFKLFFEWALEVYFRKLLVLDALDLEALLSFFVLLALLERLRED